MDKTQSGKRISTEELMQLLKNAPTIEGFFNRYEGEIPTLSVPEYLAVLLERHHLAKQSVLKAANMERSLGYQIFNGYRNARRDSLLCIAFGMQLTLFETQHLLKIAQRGELYPKNHRDAAVIFCIEHRLDLIQTEILLDNIGEALLES